MLLVNKYVRVIFWLSVVDVCDSVVYFMKIERIVRRVREKCL